MARAAAWRLPRRLQRGGRRLQEVQAVHPEPWAAAVLLRQWVAVPAVRLLDMDTVSTVVDLFHMNRVFHMNT